MLQRLQQFDPQGNIDITEAIALLAFGRLVEAEYDRLEFCDRPEWLPNRVKALQALVELKSRDALELRLRKAKATYATLEPEATKRQRISKEIAALERKLGK